MKRAHRKPHVSVKHLDKCSVLMQRVLGLRWAFEVADPVVFQALERIGHDLGYVLMMMNRVDDDLIRVENLNKMSISPVELLEAEAFYNEVAARKEAGLPPRFG